MTSVDRLNMSIGWSRQFDRTCKQASEIFIKESFANHVTRVVEIFQVNLTKALRPRQNIIS